MKKFVAVLNFNQNLAEENKHYFLLAEVIVSEKKLETVSAISSSPIPHPRPKTKKNVSLENKLRYLFKSESYLHLSTNHVNTSQIPKALFLDWTLSLNCILDTSNHVTFKYLL